MISRRALSVPFTKSICCPAGTRGGLITRRWTRLQYTRFQWTTAADHGGRNIALSLYEDEESSTENIDINEHFDIPGKYDVGLYQENQYALGPIRPVPRIVQKFISSVLPSPNFDLVFQGFRELHLKNALSFLTAPDFSNVLLSAKPKRLFGDAAILRGIADNKFPIENARERAYENFWTKTKYVLEQMSSNGHRLTGIDYTHLMNSARVTSDRKLGDMLWERMNSEKIRPNTWTYNVRLAMEAGVKPTANSRKFPMLHHPEYLERWTNNPGSALTKCMSLYEEMLKKGLFPNLMTIELLIMAHARQGEVDGISKILRDVYGIYIGLNAENFEPPQPKVPVGSPIYPNSETLKVLAISYCRNGQFDFALQAVALVAQTYKLEITEKTWDILLTWSYAFSTPKYNLLVPNSTIQLYNRMRETYDKPPTLNARDLLIRTYINSKDLVKAEGEIRKAASYYRMQIQHMYMLERERWIQAPPNEIYTREVEMNQALYDVCEWLDALGYWLYLLVRERYKRSGDKDKLEKFWKSQERLMVEFGIYWHEYRPKIGKQMEGTRKGPARRPHRNIATSILRIPSFGE
jgi:hypothetical protein